MEFNALQQYRPSSNKSHHPMSQNPPHRHGGQIMYPYGGLQLQPQPSHHSLAQQQQQQQQPRTASQPYPSWAVQQPTHNPYHHLQRGPITSSHDGSHALQAIDKIETSPAQVHAVPQPSAHTDYFPGTVIDTSSWGEKVCQELEAFPSMDPDISDFGHAIMGHDENTPIIDLRQYHNLERDTDHLANYSSAANRRMSESSFSMSSTGGLPEVSTYEDLSASEAVSSYASDCEAAWNTNLEPAPSLLSPLASPRRPQHHESVVRSGSRSRASPAPNMRSSPYTMESSRFKRWSTGHAPTSTPSGSRNISQVADRFATYGPRLNPHHSLPAYPPSALSNFQLQTQNVLYSQPHPLQSSNPALFASPDQPFQLEVPRPLPSQGLFRLLQSNADRHSGCASHFADLSDPPDLYSSLHEEPCDPPESDMNPSDPDLIPHEQDLRFSGDLYTPKWVRGHGNKREGWCGLCKPGRWLVLKNSAFWYDKSFTHGVSAATGAAFQGPQDTRRTEGNLDVWEGLCGSCGEWIALVSSKKKGTTWFRHAYKCHTHPKVKDGPKRRRETSHQVRARAVSSASASSTYPVHKDSSQDASSTPTMNRNAQSVPPMPMSSSMNTTSMQTPSLQTTTEVRQEPVVGMFTQPLHPISTFSGSHQSQGQHPNEVVSEPELVGIRTSMAPLGSLAGMI